MHRVQNKTYMTGPWSLNSEGVLRVTDHVLISTVLTFLSTSMVILLKPTLE